MSDPLDFVDQADRQRFLNYLERFQREKSLHAFKNGYYGQTLSERALREAVDEICETLRRALNLPQDRHELHKARLVRMIFGARTEQWVKK